MNFAQFYTSMCIVHPQMSDREMPAVIPQGELKEMLLLAFDAGIGHASETNQSTPQSPSEYFGKN